MEEKEEKAIETGNEDEEKKAAEANQPEVKEPEKKVEKPEGEIEKILDPARKVGFESGLPKEYQEEARKFSSLKEYLGFLHDGGNDTWEALEGDDSMKADADMLKYLKDSGMSASKAREFVKTHKSYVKAEEDRMKSILDDTMKSLWGVNYEKNKNYMAKGLEIWNNRELVNRYPTLMTNPIVADLLSEIGRANGAPNLIEKGTPQKEEEKKNDGPKSRFGIDFSELLGR